MNKSTYHFLLIILCFVSFQISAQNIEFAKENFPDKKNDLNKAKKELKDGNNYFKRGDTWFNTALDHFLKAQDFNPNNAILNYKIGKCLLVSSDKTKAIPFIEKAIELNIDATKYDDIHFLLGYAYHLNLEFDKAIEKYNDYKNQLTGKNADQLKNDIDKKIEECNYGKELVKHPVDVKIENMGDNFNTKYADHSPVINADGNMLIYTSRGKNSKGGMDVKTGMYNEDIYIVYKDSSGWGKPINPGAPLNSIYNDASVAISPDGKKLLIYKSGDDDIFECVQKGKKWSAPVSLGKNINSKYHESSASYSPDGNTIYFVSDRPGGTGSERNRDIYLSKKNDKGEWGPAENLGTVINTPYDEESVFMHPNGKTIYFSSKGHKTMGGFDIFKSDYENGHWTEPVNLGYPVNTPDDDICFSITGNNARGYYSSARPGGFGDYDIYEIVFIFQDKPLIVDTEDELLSPLVITYEPKIEPGEIIVLNNIYFDYGKAILRSPSIEELEKLYQLMTDKPSLKIEISGHTDNVSSERFNIRLSQNRANAVMNYLVKKGIQANRMNAVGYGFSKPIADNDIPEGRQKNRRVEMKIIEK